MINQTLFPKRSIKRNGSKHVNFRERIDAYATNTALKLNRKKSEQPKVIEIDSKFDNSSDEENKDLKEISDNGRAPVKRIIIHKNSIFGK